MRLGFRIFDDLSSFVVRELVVRLVLVYTSVAGIVDKMADYEMEPERQEEELTELEGFDMDTAKLENLVEALKKLEMEKRALLDSIRALRTRLAEEKVPQN